jgi:hypothetical protein
MDHQDTQGRSNPPKNTLERARKLASSLHGVGRILQVYALAAFKSTLKAFRSSKGFDAGDLWAPKGFCFALIDSVKLM